MENDLEHYIIWQVHFHSQVEKELHNVVVARGAGPVQGGPLALGSTTTRPLHPELGQKTTTL